MISLIINAGGQSERIKDLFPEILSKCWLLIDGVPIIIRNILELQNHVNEIIIVVKNDLMVKKFKSMFITFTEKSEIKKDLIIIADNKTVFKHDEGPVLGLKTGILHAKYDDLIFIPSDMPFLNSLFLNMLKQGSKNNSLISLCTENYFNPQIFLAKKKELLNLTVIPWKRVTDIYRLFPSIELLLITSSHSKFLIGINSGEEYELSKKIAKIGQISHNEVEFKVKMVKRVTNLNNDELFTNPELFIDELMSEKSYYLLLRLLNIKKIQSMYSKQELLLLESNLWQEICPLINNHCLHDLKMENS